MCFLGIVKQNSKKKFTNHPKMGAGAGEKQQRAGEKTCRTLDNVFIYNKLYHK